jgi:Cu(I)/Ag(I) efflux system membrane fusion protein
MNSKILIFVLVAAALVGGYFIGVRNSASTTSDKTPVSSTPEEKKPLYWVAPMDPSFRSDKPGKSPMGMDMVPVFEDSAAPGTQSLLIPRS